MLLGQYVFAEKTVLFITDNISPINSFNAKYIKAIQNFMDKDFGKNKIVLKDFSKFDINTTQCIELCDMLSKENNLQTVILMTGLSNYHNLYGFSSYMKSMGKRTSVVKTNNFDIYEINKKMLKLYSSTKETMIGIIYKMLIGTKSSKVFKPKVIPNFYVLNGKSNNNNNILDSLEVYRNSWKLIKTKEFDKAKTLLESVLEQNPTQSMLYYALGSVYLAENKEGAQLKSLQCFEDGILADPLNVKNICYKGLAFIYMMYQGEITAEVLYFAGELDKYLNETNEDFDAILSINTVDYNKKIQYINDWILSDMDKLEKFCYKFNVKLIFLSYPKEPEFNKLIAGYVKNSSRIMYLDGNIDKYNGDNETYVSAKKMYEFLKENKVLKK